MLLGLALFAVLLSLGPVVHLAGRPIGPGLYAWLHSYLLPLRALRAANRIGVLVVFAVSLLAALGVTWLRAHLPLRAFVPVAGALGILLALEYATFPLAYGRVPALVRPVDRAIAAAPADAVVLEWPAYVPMTDADAMFRSLGHGRRVVNGYSGFVPRLLANLSALMTQPGPPYPTPAAEAYLRRIYPLDLLVVRLDARLGDVEILREVELEHLEGLGHVQARIGMRDQVDDHVGPIDHREGSLPLVTDVGADELEPRKAEGFLELFVGEVEAFDLVTGVAQQPVDQVRADEPPNPQQQHPHSAPPVLRPVFRAAARAGFGMSD
jgi:hypothetical protein